MIPYKDLSKMEKAFGLISQHIVITDNEGRIVYANKAAEIKTGYSADEMLGKKPGELWGGHMPREFYDKMWQTLRAKLPFIGEVENTRKSGEKYWQELRIFPILDDSGEIAFYVGMEPDITSRKSREEVQNKFYNDIERLNDYLMEKTRKFEDLQKEIVELKLELEKQKKQTKKGWFDFLKW